MCCLLGEAQEKVDKALTRLSHSKERVAVLEKELGNIHKIQTNGNAAAPSFQKVITMKAYIIR